MWESPEALEVSEEARRTLEGWVSARTSPQRIVMRARIVLLAAQGMANRRIAQGVRTSRPTVLLWRSRFAMGGVGALLEDAPGRGRPAVISAAKVRRIVAATTQARPRAATHWSTRTMAKAQGVSPATVQRIWEAHGLQPHRVKTFKRSRDHRFVEKLTDVVGVYRGGEAARDALELGGGWRGSNFTPPLAPPNGAVAISNRLPRSRRVAPTLGLAADGASAVVTGAARTMPDRACARKEPTRRAPVSRPRARAAS